MHFWIDKRSQQCGFGRSRVAASLSASSGGGVGLGFGHPPRRAHSGSKNASTSMTVPNSSTLTSIHGGNRAPTQQHQQQSFCTPSTSTNAAPVSDGCTNSRIYSQQPQQQQQQHQQLINNNFQSYVTSHCSMQHQQQQLQQQQQQQQTHRQNQQLSTQQHNHVNNNPQQQQQFSINTNASNAIIPNTINNNHQNRYNCITTASPIHQQQQHYQHEMRYHHPQFGNMSVRHYQPMCAVAAAAAASGSNNLVSGVECMGLNGASIGIGPTTSNATSDIAIEQQQQQQQHLYHRMQLQQQLLHQQQQREPVLGYMQSPLGNIVIDENPQTAGTIPRGNFVTQPSQHHLHQHQQQHQVVRQSAMNYQGTPHRAIYTTQCIRNNAFNSGNSNVSGSGNSIANFNQTSHGSSSNNIENIASTAAFASETASHHHYQQHQQPQQQVQHQHQHVHHRQLHHTLIDHSETQLLPSHLKSGVCASLILASIFVAAAKFYFDHQNSGLEVLIFIAFSMTFLLAACTVSLCRIPKGMIVQRSAANMHASGGGGEHSARGAGVCTAALGINDGGSGGGGVGVSGSVQLNRNDIIAMNSQCQQVLFGRPLTQEHALAAQAGPPPYHIAILLPENACKTEEESPPPSYDKILI